MAAIVIENLHYRYPPLAGLPEPPAVLRGVDLAVDAGEFLTIMGPTGAGKTTLCMALNGLVPQSTGGVISGRVRVLGQDPRAVSVPQLAARVGMVYQDPESQLFAATVEAEVAFGPENLGLPRDEIRERVDWALSAVGMAGHRDRPPTHLSGGQQQRVAIAASLAMLPEVLILDEPTAALDPVGQHEVFGVIESLCRERRMTIVMVSGDAERAAEFSDRVAVLWEGRIARVEEPAAIFFDADLVAASGIAVPQVSAVAAALDPAGRTHEGGYRFVCLDEAAATLRRDLGAGEGAL